MRFISNLPVRHKLVLLTLPAILAFMFFAIVSILDSKATMTREANTVSLVKISAANSELVHELQKERGLSAAFLGAKDDSFRAKLTRQQQLTDTVIEKRQAALVELTTEVHSKEVLSSLQSIASDLTKARDIRDKVLSHNIPTPQAIGYYSKLNSILLSIPSLVVRDAERLDIAGNIVSYYNFLQGKERAGIERAVLSNVFAQDKFSSASFKRVVELVSQQDSYFSSFLAYSQSEHKNLFNQSMQGSDVATVNKMRKQAFAKSTQGGFGIDPGAWFAAATGRINALKTIEDQLNTDIVKVVEQSQEKAISAFYFELSIVAILIALVIALSYSVSSQVGRQLRSIIDAIHLASEDHDLRAKAEVVSEDDLGQLAQEFNAMLDNIAEAMSEITRSSQNLSAAAEEASATVASNLDELEQSSVEADLLAAASEEMTATVQEVASNTTLAADTADHINDKAIASGHVVTKSTASIRALAAEVKGIGEVLKTLHENSANITNVVEVIKSVAEQTNLLALNAAIEAARAGEQGRGFAVVADEVRTLAQRTQQSTSEIESIVGSFGSQVETAFESIQLGQSQADHAAEEATEVEASLVEIGQEVSNISGMMHQIAAAAEEQVATTTEINNSISKIKDSAQVSSSNAEQMQEVSKEQAELAVNLQDLAQGFKVS